MLDAASKLALPLLSYSGRWGDPLRPEERLVVAVLEHAVGIFQRYALASDRGGRLIFADINAWFASNDIHYPFAFVAICDVLGLDVAYVRSGLRQWRESQPYISRIPLRQHALQAVSHLRVVPAPSALRPVRGPIR
jgi:hypothetical protein